MDRYPKHKKICAAITYGQFMRGKTFQLIQLELSVYISLSGSDALHHRMCPVEVINRKAFTYEQDYTK